MIALLLLVLAAGPRHAVVFHRPDTFAGWPANGGLWTWDGGREAVVGFITGPYREQKGHNLDEPYTNRLARTTDGGEHPTDERATPAEAS